MTVLVAGLRKNLTLLKRAEKNDGFPGFIKVFFSGCFNRTLLVTYKDPCQRNNVMRWHKGIDWNYPPPSNSDHQDYYIFNRESLSTFICDCYWVGGRPKVLNIAQVAELQVYGVPCFRRWLRDSQQQPASKGISYRSMMSWLLSKNVCVCMCDNHNPFLAVPRPKN